MSLLREFFEKKRASAQSRDAYSTPEYAKCECLNSGNGGAKWANLKFHNEVQDTQCDAWKWLESLIEEAHAKKAAEFAPGSEMSPEQWQQIVTLPASIAKLKSVRLVCLYRSHLVKIPPQIGGLTNLEVLDLYTSYRLHWLPYEVTRCTKLKESRFSTRALYGNYKYRPPFPKLGSSTKESTLVEQGLSQSQVNPKAVKFVSCSVCARFVAETQMRQVWISLNVATDVLPLLVNACSQECVGRLPPPATGYVDHAHQGGVNLKQPVKEFIPPR